MELWVYRFLSPGMTKKTLFQWRYQVQRQTVNKSLCNWKSVKKYDDDDDDEKKTHDTRWLSRKEERFREYFYKAFSTFDFFYLILFFAQGKKKRLYVRIIVDIFTFFYSITSYPCEIWKKKNVNQRSRFVIINIKNNKKK